MIVIVLNGTAKSGKDQFVSYMKEIGDFRIKNYSSIDTVKNIALLCFGWNGKKDDKSRKFLSEIKRVWSEYNNGPFEDIIKKIETDIKYTKDVKKTLETIYFVHVREPEEIKKMKERFGNKKCITLLIKKDVDSIPDNDSDKNVNNYEYDITIENNSGLKEFKKTAEDFSKSLIK